MNMPLGNRQEPAVRARKRLMALARPEEVEAA
jgi:hypothetical protein